MFVFYFFAAALTYLGVLSLRGGFHFLDYVKSEAAKPVSEFAPMATVFVPCRGIEDGLEANLAALLRQNYPRYEVIFAVDDKQDASVPIIEKVSRETANGAKLIVAGQAVESSQKIHNLLAAIRHAASESKIFAFADSDARASENWLRNLVAPLEKEKIGAATGYRWFISRRRNFASEWRANWNASIASALGANAAKNFCWGGAVAVRRETFERLKIAERWRGALSDDFIVMRAMREADLQIWFVPQCLTASIGDCNLRECVEFTTRQMKITRVYAAQFWRASFLGGLIFCASFYGGALLLVCLAAQNYFGFEFWFALVFVLTNFALGAAKSYVRLQAIKIVLPDYKKQLSNSALSQMVLWVIVPPLFLYNAACAAVSRRICWRGIEYFFK
jgi:ceramide glucosyltransferase